MKDDMNGDMRNSYKKMMGQVPVRTEKLKKQIVKERQELAKKKEHRHFQKYNRAIPVSIFIVIVLLMVAVFPGKERIGFTVYAFDGTKVKLTHEAVKLYEQLCFESAGVNGDSGTAEVVYSFDVLCEGENLEKITYSIDGETTVSKKNELSENQVWFAEIVSGAYDSQNSEYPFAYRFYGEQEEKQVYVYLGSRYSVESDKQKEKKYCIEYRVKRDQNGNYEAEPFDIQVVIEKEDGNTFEKTLHFEPKFSVVKGTYGVELLDELWVSER